ncbi:MAG: hypothetical protein C4330_10225 [Chitinophagaceae bacterium]
MRKLIAFLCFFSFASYINAQKASKHLTVLGDVGIPVGDFEDLYKMGYGGLLKFSTSLKGSNELTVSTGVSFYTIKLRYTTTDETQTYRVLPLLIGYRHHWSNFFIEPQAGAGFYQMRHEFKDQKSIQWHTAFTSAVAIGYLTDHFEMSVRYQTGLKRDDHVSLISLSTGYHFSL